MSKPDKWSLLSVFQVGPKAEGPGLTGIYHMYPPGSPSSAETVTPMADITGTGQKESPYPQDRIYRMTDVSLAAWVILGVLSRTYTSHYPCFHGYNGLNVFFRFVALSIFEIRIGLL